MKLLMITFIFFINLESAVAKNFSPKCFVNEQEAIVFMCSDKMGHESGTGKLEVYGENGDLIDDEVVVWHAILTRKGCVRIHTTVLPDDEPLWCIFNSR